MTRKKTSTKEKWGTQSKKTWEISKGHTCAKKHADKEEFGVVVAAVFADYGGESKFVASETQPVVEADALVEPAHEARARL